MSDTQQTFGIHSTDIQQIFSRHRKCLTYVTSWDITSHMLPNIKWQKFTFFVKMSKYVYFLFSSKTKYLCKFLSIKSIFALFCYIFHAFSALNFRFHRYQNSITLDIYMILTSRSIGCGLKTGIFNSI